MVLNYWKSHDCTCVKKRNYSLAKMETSKFCVKVRNSSLRLNLLNPTRHLHADHTIFRYFVFLHPWCPELGYIGGKKEVLTNFIQTGRAILVSNAAENWPELSSLVTLLFFCYKFSLLQGTARSVRIYQDPNQNWFSINLADVIIKIYLTENYIKLVLWSFGVAFCNPCHPNLGCVRDQNGFWQANIKGKTHVSPV